MKFAINKTVVGKPEDKGIKGAMTFKFENVDVGVSELADFVNRGYTFCAQHKNKHRKKGNFICSDIIAVDIDDGLTLEDATNNDFVKKYATIIYTSENHTDLDHRFRIIFALEETIIKGEIMRSAYTGLIRKFAGDKSCKDQCRQFFGSSKPNTIVLNNIMPKEVLDEIILLGEEASQHKDSKEKSRNNVKATITSRITIEPDVIVTDKEGGQHELSNLPERMTIHCPVHLDRNPSAFTVKNRNGVIGVHCSTCSATYFPTNDVPLYDFNYQLRNLAELKREELASIEDEGVIDGQYSPEVKYPSMCFVDEPFLRDIPLDNPVTFVRSPKGTGKTQWLETVVKQCKKGNRSILLIGHRRSLIHSVSNRLGLTPYYEAYEEVNNGKVVSKEKTNKPTHYYAICADSLSTLLKPETNKYDVVIIDEVEQVISHLTSDTLSDRRNDTLIFFQHYIDVAKELYVLDADLNALTVDTVCNLTSGTGKDFTFVRNEFKAENRDVHLYENKAHLTNEVMDSIARNEKIFICSNSIKFVEKMERVIKDSNGGTINVIAITSKNSDESHIQGFIRNIKKEILNYDVVIVSPSLGTGVDVTFLSNESHIDVVYGFFEARVNTHFDIDQQLSRVRNPKLVKVWITPETFRFSIDPEVIKREIIHRDKTASVLIGINPDGTLEHSDSDIYLNLYSQVKSMQRGSKNNLRYHFKKLKEYNGWNIIEVDCDADSAKSGSEVIKRGKKILEDERIEEICNAKLITKREYVNLRAVDKYTSLSDAYICALRRYEIESFYLQVISKDLAKKDRDGKLRKQLRTYEIFSADKSALLAKDQIDREHISHVIDAKDNLVIHELLHEIIASASLVDDNKCIIPNVVITGESLSGFSAVCKKRKERIAQMFEIDIRSDIESKPVQQLGIILRLMGIKLKKVGYERTSDEKKKYQYIIQQENIDYLDEITIRRKDEQASTEWVERRDEAAENRLFNKEQDVKYQIYEHIKGVSGDRQFKESSLIHLLEAEEPNDLLSSIE